MITTDDLNEAARYLDAMSAEHEFESMMKLYNVDPEALHYVAEQRALRAAMLLDGNDPRRLDRTQKTRVTLSEEASQLMPHLTAVAMDNLMIGIQAGRKG